MERLFGLRPAKVFRRGLLGDLGYYFLNGIVPGLVLSLPLGIAGWIAHRWLPASVTGALAHWPVAGRIFVGLLVAEIGLYWGHRWSHEIPLLWRFHAVHHSATQLDWLVNVRGHPVDFIFTRLCGLLPLYVLGLADPVAGASGGIPLVVMLLGPAWGFFIHANVRWRFGRLEWVIASPAFHHWHHANDDPSVIDKNYAPMFPWIDRAFGTLHLPDDRQPAVFGTDTQVAPGLIGQLLDPFAKGPRCASLAGEARYSSLAVEPRHRSIAGEPRYSSFAGAPRYSSIAGEPRCSSIDSTASAAASDGVPAGGRSSANASAKP